MEKIDLLNLKGATTNPKGKTEFSERWSKPSPAVMLAWHIPKYFQIHCLITQFLIFR